MKFVRKGECVPFRGPVMTSANWIGRKWHHQKRKPRERNVREKKTSRQTAASRKAAKIQRCEGQTTSRELDHQTRMSRERNINAKRVSRPHAVNGRVKGAVRRRSYRLSFSIFFFLGFPLSKLPSPGLPGLFYWYRERERDRVNRMCMRTHMYVYM